MVANWKTVPNLPPNLTSLGNTFNAVFPRRDHSSDGAWGDAAHKLSPSGHNLDDTPGSKPETEDSDNIPELRAIDVDSDLNGGDDYMAAVINRIVNSPDRNRLYYIIFQRRICGTWTGWQWVPYNGSNAHDKHAHFSGDPNSDSNGSAWESITKFGDDMDQQVRNYLRDGKRDAFPGTAETHQQGERRLYIEDFADDVARARASAVETKLRAEIDSLKKTVASLGTPTKTATPAEIVDELLRRIPR